MSPLDDQRIGRLVSLAGSAALLAVTWFRARLGLGGMAFYCSQRTAS
jgi:hypothetical protein